ncbi:MAG: hypothetical protein H0V82_12320 [Candidatus Protochlamydia sp.]|nr:hypothetical protein [Candidatus Protochlamydia sp.]
MNSLDINYNPENALKRFTEKINYFATTSWENKQLTIGNINNLIKNNLKLLLSQTGNINTALQLKEIMLNLSKRILNEQNGSAANQLAFEVQCLAMGLFNVGFHPESELHDDLLKNIFNIILKQPECTLFHKSNSNVNDTTFVSKNWLKYSNEVKKEWVCEQGISLRAVTRCQTANDAVKFIIKNKLTAANLSDYPDLTDDDLEKLVKNCPQLNLLSIKSTKITEDKLADSLKSLNQLQHLELTNCYQIEGDKLADALKMLTKLQHLNLSDCWQLSGDKFVDALKMLTQLKYLNLSYCKHIKEDQLSNALKNFTQLQHLELIKCYQITGDKLTDALKMLTQLQHLNLSGCWQFTEQKLADTLIVLTQLQHLNLSDCVFRGNILAEALKVLTQLRHLDLSYCQYLTGDELADALKMLTQLQHLNLSGNKISGEKLADALKMLAQLQHLNLCYCDQTTGDNLANALKMLTQLQDLNLGYCEKTLELTLKLKQAIYWGEAG